MPNSASSLSTVSAPAVSAVLTSAAAWSIVKPPSASFFLVLGIAARPCATLANRLASRLDLPVCSEITPAARPGVVSAAISAVMSHIAASRLPCKLFAAPAAARSSPKERPPGLTSRTRSSARPNNATAPPSTAPAAPAAWLAWPPAGPSAGRVRPSAARVRPGASPARPLAAPAGSAVGPAASGSRAGALGSATGPAGSRARASDGFGRLFMLYTLSARYDNHTCW